ncbi:MAG: hypothetical protein KKB70_09915 [Proteobacteria bacterium]|nr:hypothetical protein [Pseudomonadota bacterium]
MTDSDVADALLARDKHIMALNHSKVQLQTDFSREADQTEEAARGFAVVADEVRKLAEKTMQASWPSECMTCQRDTVCAQRLRVPDHGNKLHHCSKPLPGQQGRETDVSVAV